jgi:hypothetical protein
LVEPPPDPDDDARLGGPTLAFGLLCVVSGLALAGSARPGAVLLAGGAGTVAIAARRGPRRPERPIERRKQRADEPRG